MPSGYQDVRPGTKIELPPEQMALIRLTGSAQQGRKPLFLHFFNPDCPCSRFNMPHFRELVKRYDQQVDFAIVLMTDKKYTAGQIQDRFDLPYPIAVLTDSALAVACGVYSTPQAVIVDTSGQLFYRGNYNRNRYCTDDKSSYARLALENLLHHDLHPIFDPMALKAYGCKLPVCTQ